MKLNSLFVSILTFLVIQIGNSQVVSCFEVESILVDACAPGGAEGQNEMVRFKVGPNSLNTANLNVGWATTANSWDGVCQDASTALKVSQLNATIQSCGILIEPTGGILPAHSKVLLISGINIDVSSNSFAGLSDSVYVIFHCSTSSSGNFANGGTGIRTLNMDFSTPNSCSDQVSYDRSLLIGGDGATVNFSPDGTASYINNGCIAPYTPLDANWNNPGIVCQSSSPIDLNNLITGTSGGVWTGEGISNGIFDPSNLLGNVEIEYAVGLSACTVTSTQTIQVSPSGNANFSSPGNLYSSNPIIQLNDLLTGDSGGIWSGSGVSGSQFDPANLSGSVTLTYTIGIGSCSSSFQQTFEVLSNKTELPNTFSPNGDGENDFVFFTLKGIVKFDVVLFNRWGNKVAEWDSNSLGWDGMSNGKESPEGVYFYIISAHDLSNNLSEYKGSITLFR